MGYSLISSNLYLYLDELQNILNKWGELSEEQKQKYESDVKKISVALSKNIDELNSRISKLETEDLEVSISVLLKELTDSTVV